MLYYIPKKMVNATIKSLKKSLINSNETGNLIIDYYTKKIFNL